MKPETSRKASQNLATKLFHREIGRGSRFSRHFYSNFYPNLTLVNVEKPPCFLRKFTPDGKRFIAFSACQTQLEIYLYKGPSAVNELVEESLRRRPNAIVNDGAEVVFSGRVRAGAFDSAFALEHVIPLCSVPGMEQLNRECSLFSEDGDFVIVGSAAFIPDEAHAPMHELHQNNESVAPNPRNPLENYTLYSIEIAEGIMTDKVDFKVDKIFLSHNQGIYLYKNILAVLSVQHQTIHIYKFYNGQFTHEVSVGRSLFPDDELVMGPTLASEPRPNFVSSGSPFRAFREQTINLLKHRILTFLYRRAVALAHSDGTPLELRRFYQSFDQLRSLRVWKMQLLDESHLLLKYASEDVVTLRSYEPNAQSSFFVVFDYRAAEVKAVYENTSEEMLRHFENFCDFFRNTNIGVNFDGDSDEFRYAQFTSSPSNNIYARLTQQRFKQTIVSAKNGGVAEARKRVLAQLPISSQSYSSSPYLDLALFSYDEKWVSVMERPKACGEQPIQFYGRESGLVKFRMYAGTGGFSSISAPPPPATRRLVAFIFHPTDPFVITVQKTNLDYIVNFHIRRAPGL